MDDFPDRILFWQKVNELQKKLGVPPAAVKGGKKRGKNLDTAEKVAKARLILERLERLGRRNQKAACDFARTTPHTFRKWLHDPDVLKEMERLKQDPNFLNELESV